jgi:hypothetical protein
MAKAGQPTKYDSKYSPLLARAICRNKDTTSDEDLAEGLNISLATLYNWKKKFPEFVEAIKEGKREVDIQVENSLFNLCIGKCTKTTEVIDVHVTPKGETVGKKVVTTETLAPNPTAIIFWLTNRRRDAWKRNLAASIDFEARKGEVTDLFDQWTEANAST